MSLFENLQHRRARVLFVSQTNFCRAQMAEAFARALAEDCMVAFSAGLDPAPEVAPAARAVMAEKIPISPDQRPKPVSVFDLAGFDVIVNLSGSRLGIPSNSDDPALILEPLVPSPLDGDLDSHRAVRDRIEAFVRFLTEHFRRAREWTPDGYGDLRREASPRSAGQTNTAQPPGTGLQTDAAVQPAV